MSSLQDTLNRIREQARTILVVGLGISGIETARVLQKSGLRVLAIEKLNEDAFKRATKFAAGVKALREAGVEIYFGIDGEQLTPLLTNIGLAVLSPGVSLESSIMGPIKRHGIHYVAELELGIQLHHGNVVVVTGSNGKSTTSSLIHSITQRGGLGSQLCGNIGVPVISLKKGAQENGRGDSLLVVEASSYQLEACTLLKPAISVVLNISENHLERHGSVERYAAAKGRALKLQSDEDLAVVNADDPIVLGMARSCRARLAVFGTKSQDELRKLSSLWAHISYLDNAHGAITLSRNGELEIYRTDRAKLLGAHNRYNMAAAIIAARHLGVESSIIQEGLDLFDPLEHRLEVVWSDTQRAIINDSKSTTVAASLAALTTVLENFPAVPVVLMIGGLSKAGSWQPLLTQVSRNLQRRLSLICFGKDGPLLASHCKSFGVPHTVVPTLRSAARQALEMISPGGIALLSPGCASFDEFTDFEDRGIEFKRYVREDMPDILEGSV